MRRAGWWSASWGVTCLAVAGCGDDASAGGAGEASLSVLVEAEDTILEGIEAGDGLEQIADGWTVSFGKYILVVGHIDIASATDGSESREADQVFATDLKKVPASGKVLWSFDGLSAGDYQFGYSIIGAADDAQRDDSVSEADFDEMVSADLTYLIEGVMTQAGGQSCPPANLADPSGATSNGETNARDEPCYDNPRLSFRLGVQAETAFGPCEVDEMPGFNVPAGGRKTVAVTIHGDHLFFNGFPEGDEGGIKRLAQWLADSDLNLDGEVTREELEKIAPGDLVELDERYQLGGAPVELRSMWDYVAAQLKTQGHFQGEGECPVDGVAHSHDDA